MAGFEYHNHVLRGLQMQNQQNSPIVIQPKTKANASIIWLHGLGAQNNDLVPLVAELALPEALAVRHVFPQAPIRPVTINQGYPMPAWYDINGNELINREDEPGILASEQIIKDLIQSEISHGLAPEQIFLAGFSQGGAMALFAGLRYPKRLGGIIGLSCYLPLYRQYPPNGFDKTVPIFLAAGKFDPVVRYDWSFLMKQLLETVGYNAIQWQEYPMEHSICAEEVMDIGKWLRLQ